MPLDPTHYITIHVDSVASFLSSVVLMLFFIFGFYYYLAVRKYKVLIAFSVFQLALVIHIFGFAMVFSSTTPETVSFWSKITYTGFILIPLAFYYFVETVTDKSYNIWKRILIFLSPVIVCLLWIDNTMLITETINGVNGHPAAVKGNLFVLLFLFIVFAIVINVLLMLRKYIKDATFRENVWPLAVGVVFWTGAILFDTVFYILLNKTGPQVWIGPLGMSSMIVVYLAKNSDKMQQTIRKVLNEKMEIYKDSNRDHLTGVFTREYLEKALHNKMEKFNHAKEFHCLLFLDMDNMKLINDKMGRKIGDMLLQIIGRIIQNYCRRSDIPARYGGDEFVLLLFNCTEKDAVANAKQIKSYFKKACLKSIPEEYAKQIDLSIGISTSAICKENLQNMIQLADLAMYYAKRKTKELIGFYRVENKFKQEYIELV